LGIGKVIHFHDEAEVVKVKDRVVLDNNIVYITHNKEVIISLASGGIEIYDKNGGFVFINAEGKLMQKIDPFLQVEYNFEENNTIRVYDLNTKI